MLARILLVEDTVVITNLLNQMMTRAGYQVVGCVNSAEAAIERARQLRPDLILMDIFLEGEMDGIDAACVIRRELDIPVIFLTSQADDEIIARAKIAEPYGFLTKPCEPRELRTIVEIAEYKHKADRKLKRMEALLTSTFNCLGHGVITTDSEGLISYMNPEAERITGCKWNDLHGTPCTLMLRCKTPEEQSFLTVSTKNVLSTGCSVAPLDSLKILTIDGKEVELSLSIAPLRSYSGEILGSVTSVQDVTERRLAEKKREELLTEQRDALFLLATRDSLTGLSNRQLFCDRLNHALLESKRRSGVFGVLSLDMDNLKTMNDTIGHHAGDGAIREFARRLMLSLRECDTPARFGGDEFAVLLPEIVNTESISTVIHRIDDALAVPFLFEGKLLHLAASIGYAIYPNDGMDADTLLRVADASMYAAKRMRKKAASELENPTLRKNS